ncbi:MAG: rhomboid family intramembrane serine protease [Phycisphaerae bacterium]|nr:rhomboid family intramembrane serine protease [Phycisphaerae bacterium]
MLLLLPIRTSIWPRRTPYANYVLILINIVLFLLSYSFERQYAYLIGGHILSLPIRPWAIEWVLVPRYWHYWQFLSYAFLHGGIAHIVSNMFFLYLFGNNINDKLGHLRYVVFYLTGAIVSGLGFAVLHTSSIVPTLGASGAISAVIGAYLVLFPQTQITVLYWVVLFIGTFEIPALYFIGFKLIIFDNLISRITPAVAYEAHLAGYVYGIGLMLALLATRILSGTHYDLWVMIRQWNRRRQYRDTVAAGYDPFSAVGGRRRVEARVRSDGQHQEKIEQIRRDISGRIEQRNLPAAADLYVELMRLDPGQLLPRQQLLDIANQFVSDHRTVEAARAYEQFLAHYSTTYEYTEQVELMLGILYSRYLHEPQKAVQHLQKAAERLTDPGQVQMCHDELARLSP